MGVTCGCGGLDCTVMVSGAHTRNSTCTPADAPDAPDAPGVVGVGGAGDGRDAGDADGAKDGDGAAGDDGGRLGGGDSVDENRGEGDSDSGDENDGSEGGICECGGGAADVRWLTAASTLLGVCWECWLGRLGCWLGRWLRRRCSCSKPSSSAMAACDNSTLTHTYTHIRECEIRPHSPEEYTTLCSVGRGP